MSSFASLNHNRSDAISANSRAARSARGLLPAAGLFLLAPLVAEFLSGNMSITRLGMLVILAPLYGGGALLIPEWVRKAGRGWPSIFVLALAYGSLEEAFLTQSLFNPNFLGQNLRLLEPAYFPSLGIGAWWTVFVLTLHTVWSIPVPIALIETFVPQHADSPWLSRLCIGLIAAVFMLACISVGSFSIRTDPIHFVASRAQFTSSAIIILVLIAFAFSLPRLSTKRGTGRVPNSWILGIGSFTLASTFLLIPRTWAWWAVLSYFSLDVLTIALVWNWSRRAAWRKIHTLSLAAGAAMAYALHAFFQTPSLGDTSGVTPIGNLSVPHNPIWNSEFQAHAAFTKSRCDCISLIVRPDAALVGAPNRLMDWIAARPPAILRSRHRSCNRH